MTPVLAAYLPGEADGAIPNGTRIVKADMENGDATPIGTGGVVVASHHFGRELLEKARRDNPELRLPYVEYLYFVVWDISPQVPVGVADWKIAEVAAMPERKPVERMNRRELEQEVTKLRHLLTRHMGGGETLWMESGVNQHGQAFVHMHWGDESGQITPQVGLDHARMMIETCAAAEFDAALWKVATEQMGMAPEEAAGLLALIREARGGEDVASATAGRDA